MNARVIDLDSRRQEPVRARCSCRPDRLCYPHQLENLAGLVRCYDLLDDGGVLMPTATYRALMTDVLAVLDAITTECLPDDERTAR